MRRSVTSVLGSPAAPGSVTVSGVDLGRATLAVAVADDELWRDELSDDELWRDELWREDEL